MSQNNFYNVCVDIAGTICKEEVHRQYSLARKTVCFEEYVNILDDKAADLRYRIERLEKKAAKKQGRINTIPKPQSFSSILDQPKTEYEYLFGPWIWSGCTTVLFSPTKVGKTTCAVQIASDIASGSPSKMLPAELDMGTHAPQTVLYFDLESDETDFQDRYGMAPNEFSSNLKISFDYVYDTIEELLDCIKQNISVYDSNVTVVIDNTSMVGDSKYQAKTEQLMKRIKSMQSMFKQRGHLLTFILIAHTHKTTDDKIELEDMSGSSNFANLSRCILAMEKSGLGNDYRILKLLDTRKKEGIEDGKVIVIKRCSDPFLHFEYYATMNEDDAISGRRSQSSERSKPGPKPTTYPELSAEQIMSLKKDVEAIGKPEQVLPTKKAIAEHYGIPESYIPRYLAKAAKIESALKD